jgi:two-component system, NarL family, response regulator NreC
MLLSAESGISVVAETANLAETLLTLAATRPDVLVMDLALAGSDSHAGIVSIRRMHPYIAILFLTQEDGPEHLTRAIAAGAHGYMLKRSAPAQFIAAVREVAKGETELSPSSLSRLMADIQALARSSERIPPATALTSREQEVLKLLAKGHKVRDAASLLLLSVKTVEAHKLNLMRKLDIHNRTALMEYALEHGFLGTPEKA